MTILNVPWRFPVRDAYCPQNKTSIRGAGPGISYKLWNKDATGGWSLYVATQEWKICDMEIKIVTFVINESMNLIVPPDRQKKIKVRGKSVAIGRVFDIKFNGIHLTQVILKT